MCGSVWNLTLCLLRMVQFFHSRSLTCCPEPMPSPVHPLWGEHQPGNLYSVITLLKVHRLVTSSFNNHNNNNNNNISFYKHLSRNSRTLRNKLIKQWINVRKRHEGQGWLRDASLTSQESSQECREISNK